MKIAWTWEPVDHVRRANRFVSFRSASPQFKKINMIDISLVLSTFQSTDA